MLKQHTINSLLNNHHLKNTKPHHFSIDNLINKQCLKVKSSIVDTNNYLNEVYSLFNRLHKELLPGFYLVDKFSNCFFFQILNHNDTKAMKFHLWSLNIILEEFSLNLNIILVVTDASIKNNVTTSISYILSSWSVLKKTIHHVVNVTSIEVEMFSIRCGINQAVDFPNIKKIIVITNTIHSARCIFDLLTYLYQLQSITVSLDLRTFFNKSADNYITF